MFVTPKGSWLACAVSVASALFAQTGSDPNGSAQREILVEFDSKKDIAYVERDGRTMRLDLFVPSTKGPHPFVLCIHGGGWSQGARAFSEAAIMAKALAARGFATASISYRLAPRSVHPAQIEDCRRALQFLRAKAGEYDLDPDRMAVLGASSGGHLAALLAMQDDQADATSDDPVARASSRVRCCAAFIAPFDLVPNESEKVLPLQAAIVSSFLGVSDLSTPERLAAAIAKAKDASPITYVDPKDPPVLIVAGEKDPIIPSSQGRRMSEKLRAAGVACEVIEIAGGGHGEWVGQIQESDVKTPGDYWGRTLAFLRRHLAPTEAPAPAMPAGLPKTPR